MSELTNKLGRVMAQIDALDGDLNKVLNETSSSPRPEINATAIDLSEMPEVMRLCAIQPLSARHAALESALQAGGDPNEACPWGAMPVDTLYTEGDATGLNMLVEYGADTTDYGWSTAHMAVIAGDEQTLSACDAELLETPDELGETPFALACRLGRLELAEQLMSRANPESAILVAARSGDVHVMASMISAGADVNWTGPDGQSALLVAVEQGHVDMVSFLLQVGASLDARVDVSTPMRRPHHGAYALNNAIDLVMAKYFEQVPSAQDPIYSTIYTLAYEPQIVRLLVDYGADPASFEDECVPAALGLDQRQAPAISRDEFAAQYRVRYGRSNPEQVDIPFWTKQMRTCETGHAAKTKIAGANATTDGPVWSFSRSGRSVTKLANGMQVLIGGAHEDHYDPNFCVYNDVTLVRPDGAIQHFIYPPRLFQPTDYHTATLVDDGIWIIGGLGYPRDRRPGETRVHWLSLTDMSIHEIATTGQKPGWVFGHKATLIDGAIHVTGGKLATSHDAPRSAVLDLNTRVWHGLN